MAIVVGGNTIDFRGIEQSVSRKDCEIFAVTCGYEMMFYGNCNEPEDIGLLPHVVDGRVHEHFWSLREHKLYIDTGHVLKYPARQYCVKCGGAMFTSDYDITCGSKHV